MTTLQTRMVARLSKLKPGTTMCPGQLSRDCGTTLAKARPELEALVSQRQIVVSQKGKTVSADGLKGPFRVRLASVSL